MPPSNNTQNVGITHTDGIERIKVSFVHKYEDGSFETENMWCIKITDETYEIDNIPFIVRRVSLGDIITVAFDEEEQRFYFESFVSVSGNSTIRVYFEDENQIQLTRDRLVGFTCASEGFLSRKMIAVNVPSDVAYKPIKDFLDEGEANKQWEYEESCLCHEI